MVAIAGARLVMACLRRANENFSPEPTAAAATPVLPDEDLGFRDYDLGFRVYRSDGKVHSAIVAC